MNELRLDQIGGSVVMRHTLLLLVDREGELQRFLTWRAPFTSYLTHAKACCVQR